MRGSSLTLVAVALGLALTMPARAENPARQHLLEQVRLGEATHRDDLVRQSLYRLELIAPDDPEVIAARVRYLLRQGDSTGAQALMDKLKSTAADSTAYRRSQLEMKLATPAGSQALQQARLLGTTGHIDEAIAAYQDLLGGTPPDGSLAVEYWLLVAKKPQRRAQAIEQLTALNARMPGNNELRASLAGLLFDNHRSREGFRVLEQMARSGDGRGQAAELWYQQIQGLPVSAASVAALERFVTLFTDGETVDDAKAKLAEQRKQLADPGFRAKATGLAQVAAGDGARAVAPLQTALRENQNDAETVGALGEAWSQAGKRAAAVRQLSRALRLDPDNDSSGRWKSLLSTNRYWLLIDEGDAALNAKDSALAERKFRQARAVDGSDSYAVLGLGDVAVARQNDAEAERYYLQALRMDRGNSNAVRGLANVYRRQSPERAMAFINTLNASQRRSIDDIERGLEDDRLEAQASELESQGHWNQAAELHQRRLALYPDSVWTLYRLAKARYAAGQQAQADALFRDLARRQPKDADQVYAYGLYLSSTGRDEAALRHLDTLPRGQWSDNIQELARRLTLDRVLAQASEQREAGQEPQAIALLKRQPASDRIDLTLADWAVERGDYAEATSRYRQVLSREPGNEDALLGLAETALAQHDKAQARKWLTRLERAPSQAAPSVNSERRLANAWNEAGEPGRAREIYRRIVPSAKRLPPSMDSALALRDAARFDAASGEPQQALERYRDAMVASEIANKRPEDNDTFTRLTRNDASDDWLKRGIRSDAADLYRQQDVNVTLDHDYWGSSGTPGYSDLRAHTTMLQVDAPLSDGRLLLRTDVVNMDAGSFSGGSYDEKWGTCYDFTCNSNHQQRANGASVAVGWRNDTWEADIGTTPMGFNVVDVVGGLSYSSDLGPFGYTLNAHRRPISSSLLSFAGQRDPNTHKVWGGVRADGGGISMSYDRGGDHGVWSSLSADQLTGKNVADNWRVRWMTGYYYKLINENNRRVTVGLTNMLWHYDKDLSGYTLGQGGYYSPQRYLSFSVPVIWRQRTENWSWELGGSVSWSYAKTDNERRYPIQSLLPARMEAMEEGSSSTGVGYTARALVERRLTSHWSIGAGIDIQEAKDYTPSHALIFVRYSMAGWQGDMDMPPQPLVPYADW